MTRLADFLREEIERGSFPGGVALVGTGERILESAAAGHAATEPREVAASEDTLYDLASLTKPLCCGALCAEWSGFAPDASPGRFLAEWKKIRYGDITLESLLTHTSGLPAWFPLYARGEGAVAYRRTLTEIDLEAAVGEKVIYSDLNFLILGEVLEVVFSAPLDRVFGDLVAAPAACDVAFLPPQSWPTAATEKDDATERAMTAALGLSYPRFRSGVVWGEVHDGNAFRRGGVAGNAGLFGTARGVWALARRWLSQDRREFAADRTPLLSEARGLAWQGRRGAGSAVASMSEESFGHTGFTGTSLWIDPPADRIAVLLTNRVHPTVADARFNEVRKRFHQAVWE